MPVSKKSHWISTSSFKIPFIILFITLLGGTAFAATSEVEPNDDSSTAQNLDGAFDLNSDPDIGDKTSNTSTQIPHQTVLGKGQGPVSKDIYQFTVTEAGTGIFDIDYGEFNFNPGRFGIAVQLDGTIWIKDDQDFYFLDQQMRPHWAFRTTYASTIHNTLTVHPVSGLFYTISRGNTNLVSIDPLSAVAQTVGKTNVADVTALAFNAAGRLFAATGSDDNLSSLYELNPDTGAMISLIGDTETQGIKGIDFDPLSGELFGFASEGNLNFGNTLAADSSGVLYSISTIYPGSGKETLLYRLNPVSGESELIGNTGLGDIAAIAFNDADHLYAISGTARSPSTLYRLDPQTGSVMETIGNTGLLGVVGIDFQPGTDTLFAFSNGPGGINLTPTLTAASDGTIFAIQSQNEDYLVTVDPNNPWTVTYQGEFALDYNASLAMSADDRLFAVSENMTDYRLDYELFEVDPTDGSILQTIGSTGYQDVHGLAFDPVSGDLYAHASASRDFYLENNLTSDLNGMFYSVGYMDGETALIQIDPVSFFTTSIGTAGVSDIAALAFNATDRLFGVSGRFGGSNTLYELDPIDGSIIQTVGPTNQTDIQGLDFHPDTGVLYAYANGFEVDSGNTFAIDSNGVAFSVERNSNNLISTDLTNGLVTIVGGLPVNDIVALAFDNAGQLFASTGSDSAPSRLYQISPLNASLINHIGAIGFSGVTGLAFHPITQELYGHAQSPDQLITIDTSSGAGSLVGLSNVSRNIADIDFDLSGILYGVTGQTRQIVTFNLLTGEATDLSVHSGNGSRVGMAFDGATLYIKSGTQLYSVVPATGSTTPLFPMVSPGHLYSLDPFTGAATLVTEITPTGWISDISFNPNTWVLNGWSQTDNQTNLVSIDIVTGDMQVTGSSGISQSYTGLAFSRDSGDLNMTASNRLYDIDPDTGAVTLAGNLYSQLPILVKLDSLTGAGTPVGASFTTPEDDYRWGRIADLAFDTDSNGSNPNYGRLYGTYELDGDVYTFNTTTGEATRVGDSGRNNQNGLTKSGSDMLLLSPSSSFYTVDQASGFTAFSFNAVNEVTDNDTLSTLNISNAQPTVIGQTGVSNMADLSFDDSGTLFAWSGDDDLYSIDTVTALASQVGTSGLDVSQVGLAFDDTNDTLYMKAGRDQYTISRIDGTATYISTYLEPPPRLLNIDIDTAATTDIGASVPGDREIPDIAFTADGRLFGYENDDIDSLVEFDVSTGRTTALWFFDTSDAGLAFESDGTLWLKDDDDGMYTLNPANGQATFFAGFADLNQDNTLAINSNDEFFTYDNSDGGLYRFEPGVGSMTLVGYTRGDLSALAFDASDRLFAMEGDSSDAASILYELDPTDGSEIAMIGDTGYLGIEAMDFQPGTGKLFAQSSNDGMLLEINPVTAATTVIGQSGALVIDDMAFSPDQQLYGWFGDDNDNNSNSRQTLVKFDLATGAATPLHKFGEFSSKLTLLDSDGVTVLATNSNAEFSWGSLGSNPGGSSADGAVLANTSAASMGTNTNSDEPHGIGPPIDSSTTISNDAYIEYEFISPGTYYIQVESEFTDYVPFGATYSLGVSIPGEVTPLIFSDSFEGAPD